MMSQSVKLKRDRTVQPIPNKKPRLPEQDDSEEELEGFVHDGCLLLRGKSTNRIFASERDQEGNLVKIGNRAADGSLSFTNFEWKLTGFEATPPQTFNFTVTDPADHCETGVRAYLDIVPALGSLATLLGYSGKEEINVWDPYFCAGRVRERLTKLGFPNVYNKNEDFYGTIKENKEPKHDVLLTNPPYSTDHIPRLLTYCKTHEKPCFLLLPSYVVEKPYFADVGGSYFYIAPRHGRYTYNNPGVSGSKAGRTAPFDSFWYVSGKEFHDDLFKLLRKQSKRAEWQVFYAADSIPDRFFTNT